MVSKFFVLCLLVAVASTAGRSNPESKTDYRQSNNVSDKGLQNQNSSVTNGGFQQTQGNNATNASHPFASAGQGNTTSSSSQLKSGHQNNEPNKNKHPSAPTSQGNATSNGSQSSKSGHQNNETNKNKHPSAGQGNTTNNASRPTPPVGQGNGNSNFTRPSSLGSQ